MLPIDEIFDVVVDSAFVGTRKPEPRIYELTLERIGVTAEQAVFIDDIEANCDAARALGIRSVWFRSTDQAIGEIEAALGSGSSPRLAPAPAPAPAPAHPEEMVRGAKPFHHATVGLHRRAAEN